MIVRDEHHDVVDAAVALDVALHGGRVRVRPGSERAGVGVRVEADPAAARPWWGGPAAVLARIEEHLTGGAGDDPDRARRAVDATTVEWDADAGRLRVHAPDDRTLRTVGLSVVLTVGAGTEIAALSVRAGAADVRTDGPVGRAEIETTGDVEVVETTAASSVRCGAGDVRVGTNRARLQVRGGAGRVCVDRVLGPLEVTTGAGSVRLGEVHADVAVRMAGGDVEVAEAVGGDLELSTGAGSVRVGVRPGVDARVDLRSTVGRASSELPVHTERVGPAGIRASTPDPVHLRARSAAGDVTVCAAPA